MLSSLKHLGETQLTNHAMANEPSSSSKENSPRPTRWIHPVHGSGVRSQNFALASVTRPLSNRKIDQYAREGRYGEAERLAIVAEDAKKKKRGPSLKSKLKKLLNDLGL